MMTEKTPVDSLRDRATIMEWKFSSRTPLVGGVISTLRTYVYGLASKWAVRSAIQQQSEFNYGVLNLIDSLQSRISKLEGDLNSSRGHIQNLEWQIVNADHTLLETRRDLAELRVAIRRDFSALTSRPITQPTIGQDEPRAPIDLSSDRDLGLPKPKGNSEMSQDSGCEREAGTNDF